MDSPNTAYQATLAANLTYSDPKETNLPFGSPFHDNPFYWASPPVDDGDLSVYNTQNNFSPVGSVTFGVKVLGPAITLGTFPNAQRVASVTFASNIGVLSVDLMAAIVNASANGEMGIYLARDVGPVIGLGNTADIYDGILAPLGNFSKRSGASFSLDIAPLIKTNNAMALYAVGYGANLATSYIAVTATIRYANLDG